MARRKKTTPKKASFAKGVLKTAVKTGASATMGFTVGVVEETVSESAANYTKAALVVGGVLCEMFIDAEANPNVAELGKASLHSGAALGAYTGGKATGRKVNKTRHERDMAALRRDMLNELQQPAPREQVPVPTTKKKLETRPNGVATTQAEG